MKLAPRFIVPAEMAMVPVLLQVPDGAPTPELYPPTVSVPPATSAWIVPWFTILPLLL